MLLMNADDVPMKVAGSLGEATLQEETYRPVIQALADDGYAPKTLGQLAANPKLSSVPHPQLLQALLVLTGGGHVHPAQEPSRQAKARCAAMNRYVCERARSSSNISFLASPVCGGGIVVPQFHQLFLLAAQHGKRSPSDQAAFVWNIFATQGRRILKDGKPVESPEENLQELSKQATEFADKRLPVLKALGVA